jgi:ribonuclease R
VGIHIADVTHYVRPGSVLEEEAYERGTSVYLVDRVVPMLPERLSNGVCSLRPNEDKLCFSAVFEITGEAVVAGEWYGKTVINSDRRFAYEEAQEIIETGEGELSAEILKLNELAIRLREKRFRGGAIAFDRVELKFNIDEKGKPISVYFKEAKASNMLIEEFMLLANRKVAELIGKTDPKKSPKTFVYRIHDRPDPEKLENFNNFIHKFGYAIQLVTPRGVAESMNNLLENVKGKKEQNVIEMKKNGSVFLLTATPETIYHRVKDSHNRPLLENHMSVSYISELIGKRREKYEAAADYMIHTDGKSAEKICEEIMQYF